jgi:7-cyano-7-deazaguanine synthase
MGDNARVLVVLSGGLDSTTLAYHLEAQGWRVSAVSFDYGQLHAQREIACAQRHSAGRGWSHELVDLSRPLGNLLQSALTGHADVPEGHYAEESMKATVVPNRNAIMMSIACGIAVSHNIPYIATAVHAGDHPVYPDCRPEFIAVLSEALRLGNEGFAGIQAPFVSSNKNWIAQRAVDLDVNIAGTWSCYKGGEKHCGRCGTCVERMEALWSCTYPGGEQPSKDTHVSLQHRLDFVFPDDQYEDNTYWMQALEGAK